MNFLVGAETSSDWVSDCGVVGLSIAISSASIITEVPIELQ